MNILIIKPSSLGDVIHALPFLGAVKDTFPDASIDWVISKNLQGLLEDHPMINELIPFNKDAWKNLRHLSDTLSEAKALRKKLQSRHYDWVVDLQGLLRSGILSYFAPGTKKIGFDNAREGSRYFYDIRVSVDPDTHAVDKCLEVARRMGADVQRASFPLHIPEHAKLEASSLIGGIDKYIVIVPSARWDTKRWSAEHFRSLVSMVNIPCIITGSRGDRKIAQTIMDAEGPGVTRGIKSDSPENPASGQRVIDLCGKTDLQNLAALIAGARAVVSNDSGPMHIAAALDIPTIAVFGPTDPLKTGPYGWRSNKKMIVLTGDAPCSPCRKKTCSKFVCMDMVSVDAVYKELKSYL